MQQVKKYYDELNIFRSIIIVWVVIGHSTYSGNDFLGLLHIYAYSFHMRAFIILSGLLFAKKIKALTSFKDGARLIGDRFLRLMVPYLFYTVVSIVLKLFLDDYANNPLSLKSVLLALVGEKNPNGGVWFLYALFVLNVFAILLYRLPSLAGLLLTFALYVVHVKTGIFSNIHIVPFITFYGVFFYLGLFLYDYYDRISDAINEFCKNNLLLTGVVSTLYLPISFIVSIIYVKYISQRNISFLLIPILNVLAYYLFSVFINALIRVKKPFMTIGNYGMDIYLIGYYTMTAVRVIMKSLLGLPYISYSVAMFFCGLILPIPLSKYIVRKFRITCTLMLGDYSKKKGQQNER